MSGHTSSPTHVARIALAAAVIGLSALATAVQASADPVRRRCRRRCRRSSGSGTARAGRPGVRAGRRARAATRSGHRPCRRSANPQYGSGNSSGPLGFLGMRGIKPRTRTDSTRRRLARCPEAPRPRPEPVRRRSCRPDITSLTDPESNGPAGGADGRRAASAGGVLPAGRATAARVLRRASRPEPRHRGWRRFRLRRRPSRAVYASAGMTFCSNISMPERS